MNIEQQRVAIAEACGWRLFSQFKNLWAPPRSVVEYDCDARPLPNYPFDLNAMHDAEKVLKGGMRSTYDAELTLICSRDYNFIWESTATQRAEAFLRTIGKWEESK